MKVSAALLAALLVAMVSATTAASPRRMLLGACEDKCTDEFEQNVQDCITETQLGNPPVIRPFVTTSGSLPTKSKYTPPKDTAFELADKKCRELQSPEYTNCKVSCTKADCPKKCDDNFGAGTLLAAWCRKSNGC